jgi:tellurite resistance protein
LSNQIDHQAALIHTMVLVSAAEGRMNDPELAAMSLIVRHLPVFRNFDPERILDVGQECAELLRQEDGLEVAMGRIAQALPQGLRETAYALACDVAAADGKVGSSESELLELIRHRLHVDRLVAAAIERGAQARHRLA